MHQPRGNNPIISYTTDSCSSQLLTLLSHGLVSARASYVLFECFCLATLRVWGYVMSSFNRPISPSPVPEMQNVDGSSEIGDQRIREGGERKPELLGSMKEDCLSRFY